MQAKSFQDLEIWQVGLRLSKEIYELSHQGGFLKDFGLRDQMRRAAVSIISNIAEGFERSSNNEFIYFLRIAKGSSGEVRAQIFIATQIGYINQQQSDELIESFTMLSNRIGAFIAYLERYKKQSQSATRNLLTRNS